jgi:hypothetical protein
MKICTTSTCGHQIFESHSYPSTWTSYSSTQHRHQCTASGCSRYVYQNHSMVSIGSGMLLCTICGYTIYV